MIANTSCYAGCFRTRLRRCAVPQIAWCDPGPPRTQSGKPVHLPDDPKNQKKSQIGVAGARTIIKIMKALLLSLVSLSCKKMTF